MNYAYGEEGYLNTCKMILEQGQKMEVTRSGPTRSLFGHQIKFSLEDSKFPLITTKKVFLKGIIYELLWFLTGSTNNNDLTKDGVHIWDEWAKEDGDLGPIYGAQWRAWKGHVKNVDMSQEPIYVSHHYIDQIAELIKGLKENPFSRRHVVSAWNPSDIPEMALAPCHCLFQFYVRKELREFPPKDGQDEVREVTFLDCQLYQRSADMFLGVPFNIASYALLTKMIAQVVGMEPGELIHTFGDMHIYENHIPQMQEQIQRTPYKAPDLWLNPTIKDIDKFTFEDFTLNGYKSWPAIKGDVSK